MRDKRWVQLAVSTYQKFVEDDCLHMAAGVAYYGFFSIFPLLLGLTAILGMLLEPALVQERLLEMTSHYLPASHDLVAANINATIAARGALGPIAIVGLLWSATGIFSAIRHSINRAWGVKKQRHFVKQKLLELGMIACVGGLFLLSLLSTAAFRVMRQFQIPLLGHQPLNSGPLWTVVTFLVPLAFTIGVFLLLYRFLPNTAVAWGDAFPGAILAGLLFELAKGVFAWYVQYFATYQLVYHSLAAVIAFLMWAYVSSVILLLGATFAAQYARFYGSLRPTQQIQA